MAETQYSDIPSDAQIISSTPPAYSDVPRGAQMVQSAPQFSDMPTGAQLISSATPRASAMSAYSDLPANAAIIHDPNDRFAVSGQGEARAYTPSAWDKITSLFSSRRPLEPGLNISPMTEAVGNAVPQAALPALNVAKRVLVDPLNKAAEAGGNFGREAGRDLVTGYTLLRHPDYLNATLPSPYGPKRSVTSPEKLAEKEHPIAMGVAGGVGSVVGSTVTDPRNWPFFASSAARPLLQKLIARGFSAQMGIQTYEGAKELYDNWDKLKPAERAEIGAKTGVGALFLAKGMAEGGVQTHAIEADSPVGKVLADSAPSIRVVDSAAAARDLVEKDTTIRPAQQGGDRRVDVARRASVADMSPEEMQRELLTSRVTGLPNRRAFDEADSPAVAMSDADGLKALNDKFGYAAGDALLRAKAEALREAGVEAYHDKGDEFLYRGNSPADLAQKLETAKTILRDKTITANVDGKVKQFKGATFSYGTGQAIAEAESGLKADKAAREARGERARGELRGLTELRSGEGAVDQGAANEEDLPKQTRVTGPSGTAEFRNTARVMSDGHIPTVSQDEILSQSIHNIISNSDELSRARIDLSTIQTTADVDALLQRASDHVQSNLDPRASATVGFEAQKQLAFDLNMTVEDLLSRRGGQAFNTEEAIAARSILKQSASHVIELSKIAAQTGDDAALRNASIALAQHQAIQEKVAGITAEAGRALGGFRIGAADLPEVKISNVLSKLPKDAQAEAMRLMSKFDPSDPMTVRRLNEFTEKIRPSTTLDKLFEYYRNSLLSSPHTIIVKTASEAAMVAMEGMKKAVAGGLAKFKDSPDRFAAESWYYAKGMAQALSEHAKPILSGEFQLEGSPGFEHAGQQAIKGKLGSVVRAPSEAMSRMTNLVYTGNYFGEINSLAARHAISEGLSGDSFNARQEYLAHHPTEEMSEAAHDLAMRNTFQSQLGPFAEKIGQAIETKPTAKWLPESVKSTAPLKWLFPFYRTPINLVKASLTHATPYELLNGITKGDDGYTIQTDAMARGLLGSSIAASLAALAISGHLTGGGPADYKKEETLRTTGWQPYSLKIGDKYYSYHRFEPVGLAAGLIADAVHGMKTGDSEVVSQSKADTAVKHIMRNLDDMPFMGTLANLLQAVHDPVGGRARSFINREAGSLIPAGIANIAETLDPTVRRPQNASQAIQSRLPGLTGAAPAIIDIRGNQVQRPVNNLGGGNPFPFTTAKHDPVVDELSRLGISTPQPPTQIKWKGKPTPLTDAERQQFAQAEGQELYKRVGRLLQSGAWQRRTDDQKRKALVELHRMIDESRPARLTRMRRQSQSELARGSL
jgi:GGDEF domain-containing protein